MSEYKLYKADFIFSLLLVSNKDKNLLKEEARDYLIEDLKNPNTDCRTNIKTTEITSLAQVPKKLKDYGIWGEHEFVNDGGVTAKEFLEFQKKEEESAEYKTYLALKKKFESK